MFNVMVDAKVQSAKLCAVDLGQEVRDSNHVSKIQFTVLNCISLS